MAELMTSYARAREEARTSLERRIADETAHAREVSQESERLTADLRSRQEVYMTVSSSVQSLQGTISELREQLAKLESDLSNLQRDQDATLAESLRLESAQKEAEDRLRISRGALLPLQQDLAV